MDKILKLKEKRAKLVAACRAQLDAAGDAGLSTEAQAEYDARWADVEKIGTRIQQEEALFAEEQRAAEAADAAERPETRGGANPAETRGADGLTDIERRFVTTWLRSGMAGVHGVAEFRDLLGGVDSKGGYLKPPPQFFQSLIAPVDDPLHIRSMATVIPLTGTDSAGAPSRDADVDDAEWTPELKTGSEDDALRFGMRNLEVHPLAKRIKVSRDLLSTVPSIEQIVNARLRRKFEVPMEKAFLTGDGQNKPLGIFVASDKGINTDRDVSTDATATETSADHLMEVKYALKPQYWPRAAWLGHRTFFKKVAKLKDNEGNFIWQPGLQAGQPDRLLNFPIRMSEFAPNSFAANQYVAALGDFSHYWIVDRVDDFRLQRLEELYAETNQIGIIGRARTDGMPALGEPFVRAQLGS